MPEVSDQPMESFVVEPVTQLDGSPGPEWKRPNVADWQGKLGQTGLIALAEGLALLGCFCLPWFSFPVFGRAGPRGFGPAVPGYSGWTTAVGVPLDGATRFTLFVHLWLVPLTAVALLGLA